MARDRAANRKRPSTRTRILNAGLGMFAKKGFAGATTREISASAGVNEVTLFRYFGSKAELYAAVIAERSLIADIRRDFSFDMNVPIGELVKDNASSVLSALRANREVLMMLMGDAWRVSRARSVISQTGAEEGVVIVKDLMEALIDAGKIRKVDSDIAARALVGMIQSYFLTHDLMTGKKPNQEEDDRMLEGFVDVFLNGIRAGGSG
ncbi:MAG: TetR/AcrR family transcriptional regulator [Methanobacteriota archaeon]|nr:MAG: TetR/AcrR family transcriptional regulator [Euryarchaeota archaeon]